MRELNLVREHDEFAITALKPLCSGPPTTRVMDDKACGGLAQQLEKHLARFRTKAGA